MYELKNKTRKGGTPGGTTSKPFSNPEAFGNQAYDLWYRTIPLSYTGKKMIVR